MTTNLLTGYMQNLNNKPALPPKKNEPEVQIVNVQKHKPDFDINRELANRTFIKPLPAKAHIVKNRIFDAPAVFVKDVVYDVKALRDGWKGNANDHQLGKLNDLGMKLGGLGIAAYLFTKRQTPTTKAMEFIGLGTFFASMALWPKLALQLPARLIHGFNVMPEYEDSYGRKKPFYQDNLFIPWDAYSDKEINTFGDRMNVPRDIPNRRDYIQEKMRKIALQNNTMWMLTAGFATPVMSALMCNALDRPVTKLLDKYNSKQADKLLVSFPEYAEKAKTNKIDKAVERLIELYNDTPLDKNMIDSFAVALGKDRDVTTVKAIRDDLSRIFLGDASRYTVPKEMVTEIVNATKDAISSKFDSAIIDAIIPNEQQILDKFQSSDVLRGLSLDKIIGGSLTNDDVFKISIEYNKMLRENINKYNAANPEKQLRPDIEISYINSKIHGETVENGIVYKKLTAVPVSKLDGNAKKILRTISSVMTELNGQTRVLDKYAFAKFGETSSLANYWNEVDQSVLKILNFTEKELELVKDDRMPVNKILREKLENIAADKAEYERVVDAICKKIATLGETIKECCVSDEYKKLTDGVYEDAATKLRHIQLGKNKAVSMSALVKQLVGFDALLHQQKQPGNADIKTYSQKDIQKAFAETRLLGVRSSFDRILNTLDLYRRFATLQNIGVGYPTDKKIPLEVMEELVDAAKELSLDAHMCDFETKFFVPRNPNPNQDEGSLKTVNGKIVYEYFDKSKDTVKKVDIPDDPCFFNNLMKLMFGNEMHDETNQILVKNNITNLSDYRETMLREVADTDYFAKIYHKIFTPYKSGSKASSETKFNRIGKSFTDLVADAASRMHNTKKWTKMFGIIFGVLTGVTVASQFFFGKLSLPASKETKKG